MSVTSPVGLLVVGGGIGGLAAALAAARAGYAVHLLERAEEFAELGAGLQLAANATRVLAHLGVLGDVEALSVAPRRLVMRAAHTGQELSALDVGAPYRRRYGYPYLVVHRNDLLTVLLAHCRAHPAVTIETGRTVHDVRTVTDPRTGRAHAEVECADGGIHRAWAVIGADGVRSRLRAKVIAAGTAARTGIAGISATGVSPTDAGYGGGGVAANGYATYRRLSAPTRGAPPDVQLWIGPHLHLVQYPVRRHELFNQAAVFHSPTFGHRPDWGGPDELDAAFARTCAPVRTAVAELDRDRYWPVQDHEPLHRWVHGRLALLGDAAHPMQQYLAQGACQALEDALALASALGLARGPQTGGADDGDAIGAALLAYQDVRLPRATDCQRRARSWGELWHTADPLTVALRDRVLRARRADDYTDTDWLYAPPPPPRSPTTTQPGAAASGSTTPPAVRPAAVSAGPAGPAGPAVSVGSAGSAGSAVAPPRTGGARPSPVTHE